MKQIRLSILLVLLLPVGMISCTSQANQGKTHLSPVIPVTQLNYTDTTLEIAHVADMQAIRNIEIRNRVGGFLERIYVDEGQTVRKGQLLFQINDEEYRAAVAKAKANLSSAIAEAKAAELELERISSLVKNNVVGASEQEVARAKYNAFLSRVEEARSLFQQANTLLSYTKIKAPFDGVINRLPLKAGSLLNEGTFITSISDLSAVYVYFRISEKEYLDLLKEQKKEAEKWKLVKLQLADGSIYPLTGVIETMTSEIDVTTGTISIRARFSNPGKIIKHGATGNILLQNKVNRVLKIDPRAVLEIQDQLYVFTVDGSNHIHQTAFEAAEILETGVLVKSGLKPGTVIVTEGVNMLKDGMKIRTGSEPVK